MGFDIYGLNPKLKSERPKIDWNNHTKAEADQYFKDVEKFEKENPGYYFRNNVWWWRPLADFVLWLADKELGDKDREGWHNNGGHRVDEKTAKIISELLEASIDEGIAKRFEDENKRKMNKAKLHNLEVQKKHDELKMIVKKKTGKDNLAPADYPEPFNSQWNDIQKLTNYEAHYPFSVENVKDFAKFCRESGGFEIC